MTFCKIDLENWDRKEYFEHYTSNVPCGFSVTADIDITILLEYVKKNGLMLYPVLIYMLSRLVNKYQEFRTCFNEEGELGYWSELNPSYTSFHNDNKSFSALWSEYNEDFAVFYQNYIHDLHDFGDKKGLMPKPNAPQNMFNISCLPWVNFTSFNLNLFKGGDYLLPIFTWGKYAEKEHKVLMPLSVQVHHGVCDGYHVGCLVNELQQMSDECSLWLK